ncbi:Hsp70 family protein [Pseudoruegeria sp. SHC-113]|uniref:Hsp70 family protein n=1 Tax=Pseudoruegeria sp. SHC-113 TaxID=2855439 RepID=UPI0021BA7C38|nr:Hsp70 family protein [Pseudoruegeria sp. SHC-113]MCT8161481.1 Hsp70 family protein [Pseudoruegeria sp. SHC-113]
MQGATLAVDFGTSNSAAALAHGGRVWRLPIEAGRETLPTAVFFPTGGAMRVGAAAGASLIAGDDGRYMRALKSVLGLPLLHETRLLGGKRQSLADVITAFLATVKSRAEAETGMRFDRVLSGRPVHFHSRAPEKDLQAEADLRACYEAAGFTDVAFLPEPEAAAHATQAMGDANAPALIVDIGGGTSDFSVFRGQGGSVEILANHGIRLGGTDFDQLLSLAFAMPALGLGGELRREMGAGRLPVPRAPYVDLATWAKIPFLYTAQTRRMVDEMVRLAVEPEKLARFATVLEMELGHDLAFAVEAGKIAANGAAGQGRIDMAMIEPGLSAPLLAEAMNAELSAARAALGEAAREALAMAGIAPEALGRVILVGGSSLMDFVGQEMQAVSPNAQILRSEAFTAVVDGLALAASRLA